MGEVIAPESDQATINSRGELTAPAERLVWEPATHQNELADQAGEYRAPEFGPGFEETAGDPRPKRFELTYTVRREGGWTPDTMSGVHAFIPWGDVDAHIGYQEPWAVELANDRDTSDGVRVPWDHGLTAPRMSARGFVV